ncbi:hypothetical protein Ngar_c34710 [Candidatus Nitrososphaera gargensis Ga9.2]|uniref:Uncharacterized protein n=1 Tax=Nitrososphaera gargensis (strain Ga9.2) TaxID=1237085 RepID=K0IG54_NITGG|nr:hypothetical protein [Candidatus Nitrososphaera gargensis]AFU60386.1 hypothetical protein Ngar_c34710 [Candidatus Nitrososphaera gargensis Ga9.2]
MTLEQTVPLISEGLEPFNDFTLEIDLEIYADAWSNVYDWHEGVDIREDIELGETVSIPWQKRLPIAKGIPDLGILFDGEEIDTFGNDE